MRPHARAVSPASRFFPDAGKLARQGTHFDDSVPIQKNERQLIEAMSGRLGMNKGRLTSLIRLSYLAPDIVRALLEGRQPIELTPTQLLRLSKDLPHDWSEQRHVLDFVA